jgi:signal transduction histidine kinase
MRTTLYGKLAAVLLGLLCLIGGLYIGLTLMTARLYEQEITQKLNRALAQHLVAENLPLRGGRIDRQALQDIFHLLMVINPSIEVYLLDPQGAILAYSAPPGRIQRHQVALDPVHRFLRGSSAWPIFGDDPRSLTRRKVFSVAPIPPQGALEGYLYIVLTGEAYDSVTQMLQGSYRLRLSLWAAGAGLVFAVATGLLLFYHLTRRLRTLAATMDAFQQSAVAERGYGPQPCATQPVEAQRGDDIDRLSTTFQAMTQRIHQQVQTLQHTDRLRRELVAHVSHDLRTPLAALHGSLETLCLKDTQLTPQERRHYLDIRHYRK